MSHLRVRTVCALVALMVTSCTNDAGGSWIERLETERASVRPESLNPGMMELIEGVGSPSIGGCLLPDDDSGHVDPGGFASGAGADQRGVDNDPFTATGARPIPGPDMPDFPAPPDPVYTVVARPIDPDEHVAARNPDRAVTGPVPAPKVVADPSLKPQPSGDDPGSSMCRPMTGP